MTRGATWREAIAVALEALRAHKLRSFLMLLGIILAVSTLIVVVALIQGVNQYIANRVANLGSNVFLVARFPLITEVKELAKATRRNKNITWEDYEALRDHMTLPPRVGVETRISGKARAGNESLDDVDIRGVTANIGEMPLRRCRWPCRYQRSRSPWWSRLSSLVFTRRGRPHSLIPARRYASSSEASTSAG